VREVEWFQKFKNDEFDVEDKERRCLPSIVRTIRTWYKRTDKLFEAMEIEFGNVMDESRSQEYQKF